MVTYALRLQNRGIELKTLILSHVGARRNLALGDRRATNSNPASHAKASGVSPNGLETCIAPIALYLISRFLAMMMTMKAK